MNTKLESIVGIQLLPYQQRMLESMPCCPHKRPLFLFSSRRDTSNWYVPYLSSDKRDCARLMEFALVALSAVPPPAPDSARGKGHIEIYEYDYEI